MTIFQILIEKLFRSYDELIIHDARSLHNIRLLDHYYDIPPPKDLHTGEKVIVHTFNKDYFGVTHHLGNKLAIYLFDKNLKEIAQYGPILFARDYRRFVDGGLVRERGENHIDHEETILSTKHTLLAKWCIYHTATLCSEITTTDEEKVFVEKGEKTVYTVKSIKQHPALDKRCYLYIRASSRSRSFLKRGDVGLITPGQF